MRFPSTPNNWMYGCSLMGIESAVAEVIDESLVGRNTIASELTGIAML